MALAGVLDELASLDPFSSIPSPLRAMPQDRLFPTSCLALEPEQANPATATTNPTSTATTTATTNDPAAATTKRKRIRLVYDDDEPTMMKPTPTPLPPTVHKPAGGNNSGPSTPTSSTSSGGSSPSLGPTPPCVAAPQKPAATGKGKKKKAPAAQLIGSASAVQQHGPVPLAQLLLVGVFNDADRALLQQHEQEVITLFWENRTENGFEGCVVFTPSRKEKRRFLLNVKDAEAASLIIPDLDNRRQLSDPTIPAVRVVIKAVSNSYIGSTTYLIPVAALGDVPIEDRFGKALLPPQQLLQRITECVKRRANGELPFMPPPPAPAPGVFA